MAFLVGRSRICLRETRRFLLSARFAMEQEWEERHKHLVEFTGGRDYEWIAAVQKKFVGGGVASAIDVDIAVVGASEKDQLSDMVDLIYKLRHCENSADALPSTEYAAVRNLLKHEASEILYKFIDDPINYGVFFNVHSACLAIDYFLKKDDFKSAAKVASSVMKQEMFESTLLNFLCTYSSLKWIESPLEDKFFDLKQSSDNEVDINDEDMKVFKFPFLKNKYFDQHFDLTDSSQLVGKTLLWIAKYLGLDPVMDLSLSVIGSFYYGDYLKAIALLKTGRVYSSAIDHCQTRLNTLVVKQENVEMVKDVPYPNIVESLKTALKVDSAEPLSAVLLQKFQPLLTQEEVKTIEEQNFLFQKWRSDRMALIRAQTEKVNYMLRLKEIEEAERQIKQEKELRHFFENRLHWEDLASSNDELYKEFKLLDKEKAETEDQYSRTIFEKAKAIRVPKLVDKQ